MRYLVLGHRGWYIYQKAEVREEIASRAPLTEFKTLSQVHGMSSLDSGIASTCGVIVIPLDSCPQLLPVQQEVETVTKTKKWVLPPVEQPQPAKKWRRATQADIGKQVHFNSSSDGQPQGSSCAVGYTMVGVGDGTIIYKDLFGDLQFAESAWIYD